MVKYVLINRLSKEDDNVKRMKLSKIKKELLKAYVIANLNL